MKTKHQSNLIAAALTCALASSLTAARAEDPVATPAATTTADPALAPAASNPDAWKFGVTVPLWAPQINGSATALGHHADVNVSFSDLKEHLDASLSLALAAQKGKFGMFGNFGYMKFTGGSGDALGGQTDWKLKFLVADAGGSYQLVRTEGEHPFVLAGTAGVRYFYVSTDLDHYFAGGNRDFHLYNNNHVFDPVLGLRASQYLTEKLHVDVAADGGGFDINHQTDWTWSASGMMTYDFCKCFSASAGYQALALNESTGGSQANGVNLIFSGVAAALTFKF